MTVRESVIEVLIRHYPLIPGYLVHRASRKHPLSGAHRLRELRAERKVSYEYIPKSKCYHIYTPIEKLKKVLREAA